MSFVLAFDLGTGGTKACLYTVNGVLSASAFASVKTFFPQERFHEQRPLDWWSSVVDSAKELFAAVPEAASQVAGIAVSGHSLGAAPLSAQGEVLTQYTPIWSDGRGDAQAARFFQTIDEPTWYETTGNGFPAGLYSIFKIMWLREHQPDVYAKTALFLGTKDYVNFRLTGVMATDHSYASGSGVYDLRARRYREDYIAASGISPEKLPPILESHDIVGKLTAQAAEDMGLAAGIPVACGGVDNACMALGAGCVGNGQAYTSLGTSAWIGVVSDQPLTNVQKRPYIFAHCVPGMFASATSIFSAGNSLRWVKNNLCQDLVAQAEAEGKDVYDLITALAAASPVGAGKLMFNPSMAGGSASEKSPNIRGALLGMTLGHTRADVLRAVLEGIAMNLRIVMDVLAEISPIGQDILLVGGGGKSGMWRQVFADVYGKNIVQSSVEQDAGSLGAMACAAVGLGLWKDYARVQEVHQRRSVYQPIPDHVRLYEQMLPVFARAAEMQADLGDALAALLQGN